MRQSMGIAARLAPVCLASAMLIVGCSSQSPAQQVNKAQQAYRKHNYHAAEVQLKSLLREHPDNGTAWALLGHTSLANRQYDDAIYQFEKAKANGQPAAELVLPLGQALVADGQYRKALETLQAPAHDASDQERALTASLRGDAEFGLKHREKAASAYAQALAIDPELSDALQGQARLALARGDRDSAHAALSRAVKAHPDDVGPLLLLGQLDFRSNRCEDVITGLTHAMQVGGDSMAGAQQQSARVMLADCQLRAGDADAAQKNIDAILAVNQNNPLGNYLQALADIRRGKYQDAANHAQATLNVRPNNQRSMTLMAWIRIAQGRPDAAQPFLTRILELAPDDLTAVRLQAGLWLAQNQDKQARELLEKTYKRHSDQPDVHKTLSGILVQLKQRETNGGHGGGLDNVSLQLGLASSLARMGSDTAAQTVVSKIKPNSRAEQFAVARAQVRIALAAGENRSAVERAEALVQNHPDDAAARTLLAQSYVADGRYDEAADALARAHETNPDDVAVVRAQAELAARRGRYDKAIGHLAPLQRAHPEDTRLTLALARLYARADKARMGIELLQSAIDHQPKSAVLNQALARAYLSSGRTDKATALIDAQVKSGGGSAEWLHLEGVAQLTGKRTDAGIKTLAQAADKAPDQPRFALDVAKAELVYGRTDAAIARLSKLRQESPDYWPAAAFLAQAQASAGDTDAALEQVADLHHAGHDFQADVLGGDVLRAAGRFEQADAAYARAYQQKPSSRLALIMFNTRQAGKLDDPAKPLEQWLDRAPDDALVAMRLAGWYQQNGKAEQAVALYRGILEEHPDTVIALNNLALLEAANNPRQALTYAKKAHEQAPDSAAIKDTLGWLMVGQGEFDPGIALLEQAEKSVGKASPEIRFHLGAALARRGHADDRDRAKTLLNQAISAGLPRGDASRAQEALKQLDVDDLAGGGGAG